MVVARIEWLPPANQAPDASVESARKTESKIVSNSWVGSGSHSADLGQLQGI